MEVKNQSCVWLACTKVAIIVRVANQGFCEGQNLERAGLGEGRGRSSVDIMSTCHLLWRYYHYHLEISCNTGRYPAPTWKLASLLTLHVSCMYGQNARKVIIAKGQCYKQVQLYKYCGPFILKCLDRYLSHCFSPVFIKEHLGVKFRYSWEKMFISILKVSVLF